MRAIILISTFVLVVLAGACQSVRREAQYEKRLQEAFIHSFKTVSFCGCVEAANEQELNLRKEDVSCSYPDYLIAESKFIDSLAQVQGDKIRRAEVERTTQRAEGMEGKLIVSTCLDFYNSKELSAIAKARYKRDREQAKRYYSN